MSHIPQASVILVASRGRESIARIMECLSRQTVASQLEVVIAARPEHAAELGGIDPAPFAGLRVVPADFSTSARARFAAIQTAGAPVVIFAEDHAFPRDANWAARLIEAHDGPHAAVGPMIGNANPGSLMSWANLVCEYGPWLCLPSSQEVEALPGHNSSYKTSVLADYAAALPDYLEAEWLLHRDLRTKGKTLMLLADVTVDHVSISRPVAAVGIMFWGGWMFAASRAASWSRARGLTYGAAAPVVFGMRLIRSIGHLSRCQTSRLAVVSTLPPLALLLAANAVGEALGHAFGDCGLRHQLARREYDRVRNVRAEDAALLAGPA